MTNYILEIEGHQPYTGILESDEPIEEGFYFTPEFFPPKSREFYPVRPKAIELTSAPDVFRLGEASNHTNSHSVRLGREGQQFCANLMALSEFGHRMFNVDGSKTELLSPEQEKTIENVYEGTYSAGRAFWNTRSTGYGPNSIPLTNWVSGENLDAPDDPGFDVIRTCGTNWHTGRIVETNLLVDTWNVNNLPLDCDISILTNPRICWATIIKGKKIPGSVTPEFPDGQHAVFKFPGLVKGVPVPLITKKDVFYPIYLLIKTTRGKLYWP